MYKVFAADDNHLTIQALRASVPWETWGFELIGDAENGIDAKEQIALLHPDIALLDINMPGMTGLEVARQLLDKKENTLFIFLTAYDEFSYAQEALKMEAIDYLLKPLHNEDLKKALEHAAEKLEKQKQSVLLRDKLRFDDQNWIGRLLQDGISGMKRSIMELEAILKREWRPVGYELLLLGAVEILSSEKIDQLTECNKRCLMSLEAFYQFRFTYARLKEGMLILLGFQEVRTVRDYDLSTLKVANRLTEVCKENDADVFVGISDFAKGSLEILPKLYDEVIFAAGSRFFLENKAVVHYNSITSKSVRNEYTLSRKMQDMFHVLYTDPQAFKSLLEEFITLIHSEDCYDVDFIKNIFTQIAFTISSSMQERNNTEYPIKSMEIILEDMRKIDSMQSMVSYIRQYTEQTVGQIRQESSMVSGQGRKVLDYLNAHYMENITLKDAADAAGVSESHLCRILKKETGDSFVNILNKIRVKNAQKLLQKGDLKVYEIAEIVGFSNYAYFYQVFKKITGYSPKEYH